MKAMTVSATMILRLVNLVCAFSVSTHAHASKLGWYPPKIQGLAEKPDDFQVKIK